MGSNGGPHSLGCKLPTPRILTACYGKSSRKVTQTCQEISNLRRESVNEGLLGCQVGLGLIEVN